MLLQSLLDDFLELIEWVWTLIPLALLDVLNKRFFVKLLDCVSLARWPRCCLYAELDINWDVV